MFTVRRAVAAIVDAHRRVGLASPQIAGISETLRGLSRQVGVSQKQARPLPPMRWPQSEQRHSSPERRGADRLSLKRPLLHVNCDDTLRAIRDWIFVVEQSS